MTVVLGEDGATVVQPQSKSIQVSVSNHNWLKRKALVDGISIRTAISRLIDGYKELQMIKKVN